MTALPVALPSFPVPHTLSPEPLTEHIVAAQARQRFFPLPGPAPTPVVVGVSGGVDSVCLLHALQQVAQQLGLALQVAHVNHRLQPKADEDAAFVARLAGAWSLPFFTITLDPQSLRADPRGIEAAARAARYAFLCATARGATPPELPPIVAVGHHADDQAETVLLRLVQGSGLRGLGAMRPILELLDDNPSRPVRLVRPLLDVRRADIRAYAEAHGLQWREDPSNLDCAWPRNQIRHVLLPALGALNPQVVAGLRRTATLLADDAARLTALDRQLLAELATEPPASERVVIALARWPALNSSERRGILRVALDHLGVDLRSAGFEHIEEVIARLATPVQNSGPHPLAGGVSWSTAGAPAAATARLSLHRSDSLPFAPGTPWLTAAWRTTVGAVPLPRAGAVRIAGWALECAVVPATTLPADWRQRADPWRAFLDADRAGAPVLTAPRPGQTLMPLGMAGQHKHIGDLFTDRKIHVTLRPGWPLVVDQETGNVIWLCGLQPGHTARVTPATTHVWVLHWRPAATVPTANVDGNRAGEIEVDRVG